MTDHFEPLLIHGDDGSWLLADSEEQARTWITEYEPDFEVITPAGWMHNVGWNRDEYESKADAEKHADYQSWWEGCLPPADEKPTEKCRRAFEVNYR